jgi:hypothetical protein
METRLCPLYPLQIKYFTDIIFYSLLNLLLLYPINWLILLDMDILTLLEITYPLT